LLGDGPVLVANTDVWADLDLSPLLAAHDDDTATLAVLPHPDPRRWSTVVVDEGRVVDLVRTWSGDGEPFLFTGFQILGASVVAGLPDPPAEFASLWHDLRRRGALRAAVVRGSWNEAGTPLAYWRLVLSQLAGDSWLDETSDVAGGSAVAASAVGARCRVGRGTFLDQCVLTAGAAVSQDAALRRCVVAGPVTVPPACQVEDALVLPTGIVPLR
jgi:NDP-sugar pyrophosphorylase family protein